MYILVVVNTKRYVHNHVSCLYMSHIGETVLSVTLPLHVSDQDKNSLFDHVAVSFIFSLMSSKVIFCIIYQLF